MAKKKPKLLVVREPNGRLSRSVQKHIDARSPAEVRRLSEAALKGLRDPEWGTELGRLFLTGKIEAELYEAGKRWSRLVSFYHKSMVAPAPDPKAISYLSSGRAIEPDPDSDEGRRIAAIEIDVVADMHEAHAVLISAGKLAESAVRATCERNEAPAGHAMSNALICGLKWLASYWGLTKQPQYVRRRT